MKYNLTGRIDTVTAPKVDNQIQTAIYNASEPVTNLTFDCSTLDFISSTGLRIVLKYKKLYPSLEVINVSNDVYSVFEMTGFSRIITVKKAMRTINLDECTLLGRGGNGEVYKINDEEIIKLCLRQEDEQKLIEEMNLAREAFVLGVPTVISFDTAKVNDGRTGIVMEAINPNTYASWLTEHPDEIDTYVQQYVDLFKTTNAIEVMPGQFRSAKGWIKDKLNTPSDCSTPEWDAAFLEILDYIPEGNRLTHNDGHPNNVLMYDDGNERQLMLIDMGDIGAGHPIMEIIGWSFSMLIPKFCFVYPYSKEFTGLGDEVRYNFMRRVLSLYFGIDGEDELDRILNAASMAGTIKMVSTHHSKKYPMFNDEQRKAFFSYVYDHKQEFIDAIKFLRELIDNK